MKINYIAPSCEVVALGVSDTILQGSPLTYGIPGGAGSSQELNEYDIDF